MSKLLVPGDAAPQIQGQAVQRGDIVDLTLDDALKGAEYLLLVFYPADFTFVCPTEIVQFMERHGEFAKQQCNVVCCSTDSVFTHLAWLKAPKSERGLGATNSSAIVLLSDRSHEISRAYGVLAANGAAYRGTFLVDKSKTICQVTINDMPVGRSVDDTLRMLTELRSRISSDPIASCKQQSNSSNAQSSELQVNRQKQLHRRQQRQLQQQQQQEHYRSNQQQMQHYQNQFIQALPPFTARVPGNHRSAIGTIGTAGEYRRLEQQPTITSSPTLSSDQQTFEQAPPPPRLARAALLEKRAAQLRLRDSETRLASVQAEAERLRATAERQRSDTERLKAEARAKQVELERLTQAAAASASVRRTASSYLARR